MQEFYYCHTDMPSYEQLAAELGVDVGVVKFKGKPRHDGWDAFTIKHPPMPASHWAKILAIEPENPRLFDDAPDWE